MSHKCHGYPAMMFPMMVPCYYHCSSHHNQCTPHHNQCTPHHCHKHHNQRTDPETTDDSGSHCPSDRYSRCPSTSKDRESQSRQRDSRRSSSHWTNSWDNQIPEENQQYLEYDSPVIVTEFLEIVPGDGSLGPEQRRKNDFINPHPTTRYLNNPVLNLVLSAVPSLGPVYGITEEQAKNLSKNSVLIFKPIVDPSGGYVSPFIPQFFGPTWLRGHNLQVGIADGLNGQNIINMKNIKFVEKETVRHLVYDVQWGIYSMPKFFVEDLRMNANMIPEKRKLANFSDWQNVYITGHPVKHERLIMPFLMTGKDLSPSEFPWGYAAQLGGGDLIPYHWHWSTPPFFMKENFGLHEPEQRGRKHHDEEQRKKFVIKNQYHLDLDFKILYELLRDLLEKSENTHENAKNTITPDITPEITPMKKHEKKHEKKPEEIVQRQFKQFGYEPREPENRYIDIRATRVGTFTSQYNSTVDDKFIIPRGKSKSYGASTFINADAQIISVIPHCFDHTTKLVLRAERNGSKRVLHEFIPTLSITPSFHRGLFGSPILPIYELQSEENGHSEYEKNGPQLDKETKKAPKVEIEEGDDGCHEHTYNSHIPYHGLWAATWSPGSEGPIITRPQETVYRVIGHFDNRPSGIHGFEPIENQATLMMYWHPVNQSDESSS